MDGPWRRQRRSGGGGWMTLLLVLLVALIYGYGLHEGLWHLPGRGATGASSQQLPPPPPPPPPPLDPAAVSAQVDPTLADVSVSIEPLGIQGAGTGIVLTPGGQVLTSHHVIKGARDITVTDVGTGVAYPATTLGYDSHLDIALLQLRNASGLRVAHLGDSDTVHLGDQVMAIGNAGGAGGTPNGALGTVSGLDATIVAQNQADMSRKVLEGLIEVAAHVVPGQSGGSLVDRSGAVVGVVAAASGDLVKEANKQSGYAVPIDDAMKVVSQIRSGKTTDTVHVGPTANLGVLISDARPKGAKVDVALYDVPADRAGIPEGAVISAVDGRPIDSASALRALVNVRKPGEVLHIAWSDPQGRPHTSDVTLAEGPPN